jgi:hypothetical protein
MPEEAKPGSKTKKPTGKPAVVRPARPAKAGAARPKAAGAGTVGQKAAAAKPAEKKLARVPEHYVFYCCDGGVYGDLEELAAGLAAMTDEAFAYHSNREKQDFCNWVRDVIEDIELANDLAMAASRMEAADCVSDRILFLSQ